MFARSALQVDPHCHRLNFTQSYWSLAHQHTLSVLFCFFNFLYNYEKRVIKVKSLSIAEAKFTSLRRQFKILGRFFFVFDQKILGRYFHNLEIFFFFHFSIFVFLNKLHLNHEQPFNITSYNHKSS